LLDAKVGSLDEEVREGRDGLDGDVRLVVRARERGRGPRVLELDLPAMSGNLPAPCSPLARRRPLLRLPPRDENVAAGRLPLISGVVRSLASEAASPMSSATSAAARGDPGGE
jgi:hypothetical protein